MGYGGTRKPGLESASCARENAASGGRRGQSSRAARACVHKLTQGAERSLEPQPPGQAADWAERLQGLEQRDRRFAAVEIAAVGLDDPPGGAPFVLLERCEPRFGLGLVDREKCETLIRIETGDETRRPTAEVSLVAVEEKRAPKRPGRLTHREAPS
jgi:hypothetical protein